MRKWSKWHDCDELKSESKYERWKNRYSIYQIRRVDMKGRAMPVPRIYGTDKNGIIYIGRSGPGKNATQTNRSLGNRIWEFSHNDHHSGSERYHQVESEEENALIEYFNKYGEYPPYNSASAPPKRTNLNIR